MNEISTFWCLGLVRMLCDQILVFWILKHIIALRFGLATNVVLFVLVFMLHVDFARVLFGLQISFVCGSWFV